MFKAKCHSCGNHLKIDFGLPQLSSNLRLTIGNYVTLCGINSFHSPAINPQASLSIGDYCYVGYQVSINASENIVIGNYCLFAPRVLVMDNNNHPLDPFARRLGRKITADEISPVIIKDNVWVGYQAFIGKGVTIGEGSIVSANSVVIRDVPSYSIVAGNPAKVVHSLK
jgi:acetyltransferase-like isoleucine patch superfamily enzyme